MYLIIVSKSHFLGILTSKSLFRAFYGSGASRILVELIKGRKEQIEERRMDRRRRGRERGRKGGGRKGGRTSLAEILISCT